MAIETLKKKSVFKIRDRVTGLYSLGGSGGPRWNFRGKVWNNIGAVLNHLHQYAKISEWNGTCKIEIPETWEIVTIEYLETVDMLENAREYYTKNAPRLAKFKKKMEARSKGTCGDCFYWEQRGGKTACLDQLKICPSSSPACSKFQSRSRS